MVDKNKEKDLEKDVNTEELGEASSEASLEKTSSDDATAGVEKTESSGEKETSKTVPYDRFKERNDKASELEEAIREAGDKFVRDPVTGKLRYVGDRKPEPVEEDEDKLTDEDVLAFDDRQLKVIDKMLSKQRKQIFSSYDNMIKTQKETDSYWGKAKEKFPEVADVNSPLYQEANRILKEEYAQPITNKQGKVVGYNIAPKAHYDAVIKAAWNLKEKAEQEKKAIDDTKKNAKQNVIVSGSSKGKPSEKDTSDEDLSNMTDEEISKKMEEEFNKNREKQE